MTTALRSPNLSTAHDMEAAARSLSARAPRQTTSQGASPLCAVLPGPNPKGCLGTARTPGLRLRRRKEHKHVPRPLLPLLETSLSS